MIRFAAWLLLLALAASAQEPRTNPFTGKFNDIDVGRATFRIYCSPCHGIGAQGGRGPDLTLGVYDAGAADGDLFDAVSVGIPGSEMAGYGPRMATDSIWRIVAYIRSVARQSPPPARGNAEAGAVLYRDKGGCAACHQIEGEGGRLGPELTRVGRARSVEYLRAALVDPDAELTSGYGTVETTALDGTKIQGIEKSFSSFSVVLMDSQERFHSFDREELQAAERTGRSLMPSYREAFSEKEVDDLTAYLAALRGEVVKP